MACEKPRQLDLELFFAGELDTAGSGEMESHLEECPVCSGYLEELQANKNAFLSRHPYSSFAGAGAAQEEEPWYDRLWGLFMKPALIPVYALLVLAVCLIPYLASIDKPEQEKEIIYKGKTDISFIYRRDGKVYDGSPDISFLENDEIQIFYTSTRYRYMTLISVDRKGQVSFYQPGPDSLLGSIEINMGAKLAYPRSIILDDTKGWELFTAIFSNKPVKKQEVDSWLKNKKNTPMPDPVSLEHELNREPLSKESKVATILITKG
ncbi:anti-sigma factor family protein [Fibrobacterota bacterium]